MAQALPCEQKPQIPNSVLEQWDALLDVVAAICRVPVTQIMRAHETEIELVAKAGTGLASAPRGTRMCRAAGVYCARVMSERQELLIPDAREDPEWRDGPAVRQNMISYLGFPLSWPDGDLFGTICVLDTKANAYPQDIRRLLERFRDAVETSLALVYEAHVRQQTQKDLNRRLEELQAHNRIMTGRELRMVELKQEVDELRRYCGMPAKYDF
jgi:GAF domain-containing protein